MLIVSPSIVANSFLSVVSPPLVAGSFFSIVSLFVIANSPLFAIFLPLVGDGLLFAVSLSVGASNISPFVNSPPLFLSITPTPIARKRLFD